MPERNKYEDKVRTRYDIVKVGEKWVQKEITITETFPVYEDVDLYNEDDEIIGTHQVAVMESYEEEEEAEEEEAEEEEAEEEEEE